MLLPEMTPGTQRALLAALAWKAATQANDVKPFHLLLGLLHEEEGTSAKLLAKQQIHRENLLKVLGIESQEIQAGDELPAPLDLRLEKLLYDARLMALEFTGSPVVNSEHLLLTLLESDLSLRDQLHHLGYQHQLLRQALTIEERPDLKLEEPLRLAASHEEVSIARILDANINRAREALRVLEESARFHLNDALLSRLAKELRHDLTQAVARHLSNHNLLRSRETEHDVGTGISTAAESYRSSLQAVLRANAQRLQEALRSLEEYGKVISPEFGSVIEKVRYRAYTLERTLFLGERTRDVLKKAHLYLLVSKGSCMASIEWTIQEAAMGGVSIVQLREKNKSDQTLLAIAREVREATRKLGVLFIMNDRPDLAKLSQADGVHLGQDDIDVMSARNIVGTEAIIGVSTHSVQQLEKAVLDGADYVGVGPTFASKTKQFDSLAGLEYVRQAVALTSLPTFAIGGIDLTNVAEVAQAGMRRVAVGQAITQADEPRQVARVMWETLTRS